MSFLLTIVSLFNRPRRHRAGCAQGGIKPYVTTVPLSQPFHQASCLWQQGICRNCCCLIYIFCNNLAAAAASGLLYILCLFAGIEPTARREAWKWLLGVYPAGSSSAQRQQQRLRQQQQYALLQGQWAAVGPEQARRWGKWRERRSRIDKDVARTDR